MRSLFLKIFFSFWLTTVLVGLVMYFIAHSTRSEDGRANFRHFALQAAEEYGEKAVDALQQGGIAALKDYVDTIVKESGVRIFLFAGQEGPLTGQPLPATGRKKLEEVLAGKDLFDMPHSNEKWIGKILQFNTAPQYVILLNLPQHKRFPFRKGWQRVGFQFLIFLGVGGLICFYLARSLTAPIRKLRQATHPTYCQG